MSQSEFTAKLRHKAEELRRLAKVPMSRNDAAAELRRAAAEVRFLAGDPSAGGGDAMTKLAKLADQFERTANNIEQQPD